MEKKTVVFFSAVGGYDTAARAIKEQFEQRYPDYEVVIITMHEYTSKFITKVCDSFHINACRFVPWMYSMYNSIAQNKRKKKLTKLAEKYKTHGDAYKINEESTLYPVKRMKNIYDRFKPLAMVSFQIMPQALVVAARKKYKFDTKTVAVLSDYALDIPYVRFGGDGYCVDNEDMKQQITCYGIADERVKVFGLPAANKFTEKNDKKKMRAHFELPDRTTVIVTGGSFGAGSVKIIFKQLLKDFKDINIIAVAGRNESLKLKLEKVKESMSAENGYILGYTTEFDMLLDAADVMVCKPGAMSVNEAFLKGIPVIAAYPSPSVEEDNVKYFQKGNLALYAKDSKQVSDKLRKLLNNPEVYNEFAVNITKHAKKDAAKNIAGYIHELSEQQLQENIEKTKSKV